MDLPVYMSLINEWATKDTRSVSGPETRLAPGCLLLGGIETDDEVVRHHPR
jgi:hypothetical protein